MQSLSADSTGATFSFRYSGDSVRLKLSPAVEAAIREAVGNGLREAADFLQLKIAFQEMSRISGALTHINPLCVLSPIEGIKKVQDIEAATWCIAQLLGSPLVQDADGRKLVRVFDRRLGTMAEGGRYHRTREGGSIHTDSDNDSAPLEYVILACGAPGALGGESIFVNAHELYSYISSRCFHALQILEREFLFDRRGMPAETAFCSYPIVKLDHKGVPHFRYLRTYIEAAHEKAKVPLTDDQIYAMDVLDAALGMSELQLRMTLRPGEIAIFRNSQLFHGRTSFVDPYLGSEIQAGDGGNPVDGQRVFFRVWISGATES